MVGELTVCHLRGHSQLVCAEGIATRAALTRFSRLQLEQSSSRAILPSGGTDRRCNSLELCRFQMANHHKPALKRDCISQWDANTCTPAAQRLKGCQPRCACGTKLWRSSRARPCNAPDTSIYASHGPRSAVDLAGSWSILHTIIFEAPG